MSFIKDFKDANQTFEYFKNEITKNIKGEILSIELLQNSVLNMFDYYSGIDAIHIYNNQMRGIAVRVQWSNKSWNTFTIRYKRANGSKTEYKKRREAIYGNNGWFYPFLTIQAYFDKRDDNPKMLSFGIVRTKDLYDYIEDNKTKIESKLRVCPEGNSFIYVSFKDLQKAGKKIIIKNF